MSTRKFNFLQVLSCTHSHIGWVLTWIGTWILTWVLTWTLTWIIVWFFFKLQVSIHADCFYHHIMSTHHLFILTTMTIQTDTHMIFRKIPICYQKLDIYTTNTLYHNLEKQFVQQTTKSMLAYNVYNQIMIKFPDYSNTESLQRTSMPHWFICI